MALAVSDHFHDFCYLRLWHFLLLLNVINPKELLFLHQTKQIELQLTSIGSQIVNIDKNIWQKCHGDKAGKARLQSRPDRNKMLC